jgi:hypothetical protein
MLSHAIFFLNAFTASYGDFIFQDTQMYTNVIFILLWLEMKRLYISTHKNNPAIYDRAKRTIEIIMSTDKPRMK